MKSKRIYAAGIIVLAALVAIVWSTFRSRSALKELRRRESAEQRAIDQQTRGEKSPSVAQQPLSTAEHALRTVRDTVEHLQKLEHAKDEWRTAIEFYGKAVDENGVGVSNASVVFTWTDLSSQGHSSRSNTSDDGGLFSLTGVRGKHLSVAVSREGYYTSKSNVTGFTYSGESLNFVPNSTNPIIFRLHKKRECERLLHTEFPGFSKIFHLTNGALVQIDLLKERTTQIGKGHLQVRRDVSDIEAARRGERFGWKLSVLVPDGGILEATEEFDFTAPESGYSPEYELSVAANQHGWTSSLEKKLFVHLQDGTYGRISLRLMANNGVFSVESFINPSGSRNLEYNPAVQPNPTSYE